MPIRTKPKKSYELVPIMFMVPEVILTPVLKLIPDNPNHYTRYNAQTSEFEGTVIAEDNLDKVPHVWTKLEVSYFLKQNRHPLVQREVLNKLSDLISATSKI